MKVEIDMPKKIFIANGHGGRDSGAVGCGLLEKDINLDIGMACANYLANYDTTLLISRNKDEDDSVAQEVAECNAFKPEFAIAFHTNSNTGKPADGGEAFCTKDRGLAYVIGNNILRRLNTLGQNIRSGHAKSICCKTKVREDGKDYYYFIRECNCQALILEIGFINNTEDIKFFDTVEKRQMIGVECAKAIAEEMGLAQKETPKKSNKQIVEEVIKGVWGTGAERKSKLTNAGYNYTEIQNLVNKAMGYSTTKPKKTNKEIAQEVIKGLWGNGAERKARLEQAGYNYNSIQTIVNGLVKKK